MLPPSNSHATSAEQDRFAKFLAALEAEGLSPSTRACYASDWINVAEHARKATRQAFRIDRYAPDHFLAYRAEAARRGVSPATLNRRLAFLRRYAAYAGGAAEALERIPFQPVTRPATRALPQEEEKRLRGAAERLGPREHALIALFLGTGLRSSEVAALTRGDVEGAPPSPHAVRVRGPRQKIVVLPPRAAAALGAFLPEADPNPDAPLFAEGSHAASEARIATIVARIAREADVEATPRTLRHTFAVRYLQEHREDVTGLARALGQHSLASARTLQKEANVEAPTLRVARAEDLPEEQFGPLVARRTGRGDRLEVARVRYLPGARIAVHRHDEERIMVVVSGRLALTSGRLRLEAGPGDVVFVPAEVPHAVRVLGERPVTAWSVCVPAVRAVTESG